MKTFVLLLSLGFVLPVSAEEKVDVPVKQDVIRISPETTRITGPLDSRGFVNYAEYLNQQNSQGVTPETNAAVLYWKAIGPNDEATSPEFRAKLVQKLGVDVFAGPGPYLTDLISVGKKQGQPDLYVLDDEQGLAQNKPWKRDDHPVIAAWLDANEHALKLVSEGSRRPHYYNPIVILNEGDSLLSFYLSNALAQRQFARMYQARSMLYLGEGDSKRAKQDLLSLHRFARHVSQGSTMIEWFVAIAMESMANASDMQLALRGQMTGPELTAWRNELAALPSMQSFKKIIDEGERIYSLDATQDFAKAVLDDNDESVDLIDELGFSGGGEVTLLRSLMFQFGYDWNVVLTMVNAHFDQVVQMFELPTYQKRQAALEKLEAALNGKAKRITSVPNLAKFVIFGPEERGRQLSTVLLSLMTQSIAMADTAEIRAIIRQEITQVGLAIEAYRANKGQLPQSLDVLTPNYLKTVPLDLYNDEPLNYRVRGNEYAVYSVGNNLTDDNGIRNRDADDIAFCTNGWAEK